MPPILEASGTQNLKKSQKTHTQKNIKNCIQKVPKKEPKREYFLARKSDQNQPWAQNVPPSLQERSPGTQNPPKSSKMSSQITQNPENLVTQIPENPRKKNQEMARWRVTRAAPWIYI